MSLLVLVSFLVLRQHTQQSELMEGVSGLKVLEVSIRTLDSRQKQLGQGAEQRRAEVTSQQPGSREKGGVGERVPCVQVAPSDPTPGDRPHLLTAHSAMNSRWKSPLMGIAPHDPVTFHPQDFRGDSLHLNYNTLLESLLPCSRTMCPCSLMLQGCRPSQHPGALLQCPREAPRVTG